MRTRWNVSFEAARAEHAAIDPFTTPVADRLPLARRLLRLTEFTAEDGPLLRRLLDSAAAMLDTPEAALKLRAYLQERGQTEAKITQWYTFPAVWTTTPRSR